MSAASLPRHGGANACREFRPLLRRGYPFGEFNPTAPETPFPQRARGTVGEPAGSGGASGGVGRAERRGERWLRTTTRKSRSRRPSLGWQGPGRRRCRRPACLMAARKRRCPTRTCGGNTLQAKAGAHHRRARPAAPQRACSRRSAAAAPRHPASPRPRPAATAALGRPGAGSEAIRAINANPR